MQTQLTAMEDEKTTLEAKVLREHEQFEAATTQNTKLLEQIQAVTKSMEEKCQVAVSQAEHQMSQLQVQD